MPQQQRSIEEILLANGHYPPEAFAFVQRGLTFTVEQLGRRDRPEGERHVTGQELCLGLRDLATREFGYLAKTVLAHMNIRRTDDFGKIVFYLLEHQLLQKRPEDSLDDFHAVFPFADAFEKHFSIKLEDKKEEKTKA